MRFFLFFVIICISCIVSAQNTWTQLPDFPGAGRDVAIEFALDTDNDGIADRGYVGGGWNSNGTAYTDMWEYNPISNTWASRAAYPGLGTRTTSSFVLNNVAYVVGGAYGSSNVSAQVWAYTASTDTWTRKNDFPINVWGGETFVLNNKAYYVAGSTNGSIGSPVFNYRVYEYNAANDSWIAKNTFPFLPRTFILEFALDTDNDGVADRAFVGCGQKEVGVWFSDLWEYLPATDTWVQRADIPGSARGLAESFSIGPKGYAGLGLGNSASRDLYEYDPLQNNWLRMSDHPGTPVMVPSTFVIGNSGYVACGKHNNSSAGLKQFYKYSPLIGGYSEIRGNIFADGNANCTMDGAEFPLANIPVEAMPGQYLTSTDNVGNYVFRVPVGTYSIAPIIPQYLSSIFPGVNCPNSGFHDSIVIDSLGIDTSGFDFGVTALQCPRLSAQVASSGRLRCFINHTVISYCNYGLTAEDSVFIVLTLPDFITIDSASHIFTSLGGSAYRFEIGQLDGGKCGEIHIVDYVSCADVNLLGAAACTEVNIYPHNTCLPIDTGWSGANVDVSAICVGGDTVQLTITNNGSGDMADSSELRIYFDGALGYTENFKLAQGDFYYLYIPSGGSTIMVEADQVTGHPYNHHVTTWMERCTSDTLSGPLFTIIPQLPLGDEYEQYDVECLEVAGSFDPNDKHAYPSGVTNRNIVPPGTLINYKLRFQNTGTATAQDVYLVDTLDSNLDLSTLRINASSHPYRFELSGIGKTILKFYYDNIMLPDSNANELASHGFISFSIAPKANTPLGTQVNNFADIYFDLNPPVRTNTAMLTFDNMPVNRIGIKDGNTIIISGINGIEDKQTLGLFPNPTNGMLNILASFPASGKMQVSVTDLLGRTVLSEQRFGAAGGQELIGLDVSSLPSGIYIVAVNIDGKLTTGKLIKE